MTKQVQRRRGTASQHTSFTGADGELSVNTTNKSVHVHDGVTTGGIEAARADLGNVGSSAILTAAGITSTVAELNYTDGVTSAIQTQLNAKAPINNATFTGTTVVPTADINGGTIDGTTIGSASPAAITGTAITGTSFVSSGNMNFGDNDKAVFGAGADLQIFHDAGNSYISDVGTGDLIIRAGNLRMQNSTGTAQYILADDGGAVQLRYNGTTKIATTATGIDVTGGLNTTGSVGVGTSSPSEKLTVIGNGTFGDSTTKYNAITINGGHVNDGGNDYGLTISSFEPAITLIDRSSGSGSTQLFGTNNGGLWLVGDTLNDGTIGHTANTTDFFVAKFEPLNTIFYTSGVESMRISSTGSVGIGTSSPSANLSIVGSGNGTSFSNTTASTAYNLATVVGNAGGSVSIGVDNNIGTALSAGNYGGSIQSTNNLAFSAGGAERLRIDASGNVGIGTSSPSTPIHLVRTSNEFMRLQNTTAGVGSGYISFYETGGTRVAWIGNSSASNTNFQINNQSTGGVISLSTNGTERLRIDASGNLLVGTTSTAENDGGISTQIRTSASGSTSYIQFRRGTSVTAAGTVLAFFHGGTLVGSVTHTNVATSFNTSSDYRLKDDVQPMVGASGRVLALNPVNFAWKVDGSRTDGFLAHELQEVIPAAAHGTKDEVDADGKPVYQGIDQSKIVPLLTAALQEALNKIDALEARIVTLETKP